MCLHKCEVCGKNFESQHPNAKYCCTECKKIGLKPSLQKSQRKYTQKVAAKRKEEKSNIVGKCKICGEPVLRESGRFKYCSDQCVEIAKRIAVKKHYHQKYKHKREYDEKLRLELNEIRKKSHLNKDLKDLEKNGEKLGLKSYDYGKYARMKGR